MDGAAQLGVHGLPRWNLDNVLLTHVKPGDEPHVNKVNQRVELKGKALTVGRRGVRWQ